MSRITLVVATDAGHGIGAGNKMPWHLPEDLAHFKRLTTGRPVIMGRKTFDSIGRVLPNRRNIVITRNAEWRHDGVDTAGSLDAAIALCGDAPEICVIGGGQIFAEAIRLADRIELTEIGRRWECDTFFPELDPAVWQESARESHHCANNGFDYSFVTLERKLSGSQAGG